MEPVPEKAPRPAAAEPAGRPERPAPAAPAPAPAPAPRRGAPIVRVTPLAEGPLLVDGPVEIVLADGTVRRSERPVVALCRCRRSLLDPFCDTSHRRRVRAARPGRADGPEGPDRTGPPRPAPPPA
ncbi:CDGSH iron-sulfur domain-containing protein [Streptomyces sp. NPDC002262]|uniref:CDGSH iron-sulfur domain-containing protein n=1 Tax=Streptomyces sp. NPDC002262 TaxID=3154414 RepID=UPI00331705C4